MRYLRKLGMWGILFFALFCLSVSPQSYQGNYPFLTAGVNVNLSTAAVNGTDFTSEPVWISRPGCGDKVAITVTFTRAAGTASTVDFEFQASYDGGTTWTTAYFVNLQTATNETAVSNVVRKITLVNVPGVSHLRLYRINNTDAANNLTACNASVSLATGE